jgi:DNA repair protein RecO (recombination protein O)
MVSSESIVISKREFNDADLLVIFLSSLHGRLTGVAKNAKKSKKRFGGCLENGYVLLLNYERKRGDLVTITSASLVSPLRYRTYSLHELYIMHFGLELALRFMPEGEIDEKRYELLKRFLISIHEGRLTRGIFIYFLLRWFNLSGFLPDISSLGADSNLEDSTLERLQKILKGSIESEVSDEEMRKILEFITGFSAHILGTPLRSERYINDMIKV